MKMTDMRAKARAIFGPAIAEPMPKQPNGAKALQERANARPIPTYKVGGSVKKSPPQPTAAEREADRKRRESLANTKVTQSEADTLGRAMRSEGPRYKDDGKVMMASPQKKPKTGGGQSRRPLTSDELERRYDKLRQKNLNDASMTGKPTGYSSSMKHGGKVQTSADTAKKLATEMGGMKKGGKAKKDGLAVMIAIGSPMKGMKKPVKKAQGGAGKARKDQSPIKKARGGGVYQPSTFAPPIIPTSDPRIANDTSKKIGPVKRAQGGAGKVRKGMMTPEGKIVDAMNKVRGK